jgi:catechol 2,3-dioxygenase-like lactoylglutathione lyase family enzyme
MRQRLAKVAVVVDDYDEALEFYVGRLGFELTEDTELGGGKRWVTVAPPGSSGAQVLLAEAASPEQRARIGNQTGGRVFLFVETDDIARDVALYRRRGVNIVREPVTESYGTVAVFEDLYGNQIDLIEPGPDDVPGGYSGSG